MPKLIPNGAPMRARLREPRDLRDVMRLHHLNVRELSELCGGVRHRSTVGHLHSGARNTCSIALATRIEYVLRLSPGFLFTPVMRSDMLGATTAPMTRKKAAA